MFAILALQYPQFDRDDVLSPMLSNTNSWCDLAAWICCIYVFTSPRRLQQDEAGNERVSGNPNSIVGVLAAAVKRVRSSCLS